MIMYYRCIILNKFDGCVNERYVQAEDDNCEKTSYICRWLESLQYDVLSISKVEQIPEGLSTMKCRYENIKTKVDLKQFYYEHLNTYKNDSICI